MPTLNERTLKSWRTRPDYRAQCLTCGAEQHTHKKTALGWARKHATAKKHTVHVDVTYVRVYAGERSA